MGEGVLSSRFVLNATFLFTIRTSAAEPALQGSRPFANVEQRGGDLVESQKPNGKHRMTKGA